MNEIGLRDLLMTFGFAKRRKFFSRKGVAPGGQPLMLVFLRMVAGARNVLKLTFQTTIGEAA